MPAPQYDADILPTQPNETNMGSCSTWNSFPLSIFGGEGDSGAQQGGKKRPHAHYHTYSTPRFAIFTFHFLFSTLKLS